MADQCNCDLDLEHAQAVTLIEQAKAHKFIMIFCGSMAALMPVLLVILPFVAAMNNHTWTPENSLSNSLLAGYSLVLTCLFGLSQKKQIQDKLNDLTNKP